MSKCDQCSETSEICPPDCDGHPKKPAFWLNPNKVRSYNGCMGYYHAMWLSIFNITKFEG